MDIVSACGTRATHPVFGLSAEAGCRVQSRESLVRHSQKGAIPRTLRLAAGTNDGANNRRVRAGQGGGGDAGGGGSAVEDAPQSSPSVKVKLRIPREPISPSAVSPAISGNGSGGGGGGGGGLWEEPRADEAISSSPTNEAPSDAAVAQVCLSAHRSMLGAHLSCDIGSQSTQVLLPRQGRAAAMCNGAIAQPLPSVSFALWLGTQKQQSARLNQAATITPFRPL